MARSCHKTYKQDSKVAVTVRVGRCAIHTKERKDGKQLCTQFQRRAIIWLAAVPYAIIAD